MQSLANITNLNRQSTIIEMEENKKWKEFERLLESYGQHKLGICPNFAVKNMIIIKYEK